MVVHLIDGTYELFRHFYGLKAFQKGEGHPLGAVSGVLYTVVQMIEKGATHLGVATDHTIESFRNDHWEGYKRETGDEPTLTAQFHPLEDALASMGVKVWPMVEFEADDALAAAAVKAADDARVDKVCIWTPDKDLAQVVRGDRIVQMDRRKNEMRDEDGVIAKFGVPPVRIPDYLALVGDAADGYPGIAGIGPTTAGKLIAQHGAIEEFPPTALSDDRIKDALLFKFLATLRVDVPVFDTIDDLEWRGATPGFEAWIERLGDERLRRVRLA